MLLLLAVSSLFVVISCQTVSTSAISSAASDAAAEATKYKSKHEDKYSDKYDDKEVGQPCTPISSIAGADDFTGCSCLKYLALQCAHDGQIHQNAGSAAAASGA